MLENARRQFIVVLLATIAAIAAIASPLELVLGLDLDGGTQLIYNVDVDDAKRKGHIPQDASETDIANIIASTVDIISKRIDPQGTRDAVVTRRGETGILIELPNVEGAELAEIESRIEDLGQLELRIVAEGEYNKPVQPDASDRVKFDLTEEKRRLQEWLDKDDGTNRKRIIADYTRIDEFHALPEEDGGRKSGLYLKWFPRLIRPSVDNPELWDRSESWSMAGPNPEADAVPAFTQEHWNAGLVKTVNPDSKDGDFLVEFMPINMHERHFEGKDLDPGAIASSTDEQTGRPCVVYAMSKEAEGDYADWSEEYINKRSAIILNGTVFSAPVFNNRLAGGARITSRNFTKRQVDSLVRTLKTGSLKVKPERQSRLVIGASLGEQSIERAYISIAVGAALVLLFILAYYRLAGIVAFAALALNILLILASLILLRSTLTLPGLAGLVLTMGMAIDANILIYERIREEITRGKALLQACRTGFDRAIVTIIDAQITTFIAGVVLYQVGVGPIRGFAVTLMIGILTTLFTAFFVSRLVFHFLLEKEKLSEFRVARWLADLNIDFMKWAKTAGMVSAVAIVVSLGIFGTTSAGSKYSIDFTGGANLRVQLAQGASAQDIRKILTTEDNAFTKEYQEPVVNTVGEAGADGTHRSFSIRIKLTEDQRKSIDEARRDAEGEFEAPYKVALREALESRLVPDPFSNPRVDSRPDNTLLDYAQIDLHFVEPVRTADLSAQLAALSREVVVRAQPEGESGTNFLVEWDVEKDTPPEQLFGKIAAELNTSRLGPDGQPVKMVTLAGTKIELSDPIPESSDIGGRMVGELRNSAVSALVIALFVIVLFIRVRFNEYKYGFAAVAALIHDVLITLGFVVAANAAGIVDAEISLAMIAAFLTIIGYSINDTIVIFDRVRENLTESARLGEKVEYRAILNKSINQTLSRTILTTATTMFVVLTQFVVNYGSGTELEGFSFALLIGLLSGTYSTIFIASPVVHWLWRREGSPQPEVPPEKQPAEPAPSGA